MGTDIYGQDGVDVPEGDRFSAFAATICRDSYKNSPFVEVVDYSKGLFRGPRGYIYHNLPGGYSQTAAPDGIGTKVIIIDAISSHQTAGFDLMAMTCGDITRNGGLPLLLTNVLDVKTLGTTGSPTNDQLKLLIAGLGEAAKAQNIVLLNGETAEMGPCVGSPISDSTTIFNWAGAALGVYHPDKMITGETLAPGQIVVALREKGFRSNGNSVTREAFRRCFGEQWFRHPDAEIPMKAAAIPSTLYDQMLTRANGWYGPSLFEGRIHAIVHITGGGIESKLGKDILFPRGLSALLDDLWEPPEIMRHCAEWREIDDREFYRVWGGGQGGLVVIDPELVDQFTRFAAEWGVEAQYCGEILKTDEPEIELHSKLNETILVYTEAD